jgi:hypothetical protein
MEDMMTEPKEDKMAGARALVRETQNLRMALGGGKFLS